MDTIIRYGATPAVEYACSYLKQLGFRITSMAEAHGAHLLLDVPSFRDNGMLRDGSSPYSLWERTNDGVTVWGGNLAGRVPENLRTVDLLKDPEYLAQNAWITAECALDVTLPLFSGLLRGCPILVIGWGRIGKSLARLLRGLDADVTVAARKASDRAMLAALGYRAVDTMEIINSPDQYRILYNTVPAQVLNREALSMCRPDCLKIELASRPGIVGDDVVIARGLPGIHRPEASGQLIADTVFRLMKKEVT